MKPRKDLNFSSVLISDNYRKKRRFCMLLAFIVVGEGVGVGIEDP